MKSSETTQKSNFVYLILLLLVVLLFIPLFTNAQTTVPFKQRYEKQGINGDLTIIGNTNLGKFKDQPYNGGDVNNESDMMYIDIDNDASTFNSSSANFTTDMCNKIVYAGLYWGTKIPSDLSPRNQVKFKVPGGAYVDITADVQLDRMYYKDVTDIATASPNPSGDYFVANVNTKEALASEYDSNNSAGWALVIVYEDPTEPRKYISTFDGFTRVNGSNPSEDIVYSGFKTPPSGPVEGRIGVVAMEGDLKWTGDQLYFKSNANTNFTALFDAESPVDNFFNSKITKDGAHVTNRNVNSENTLGWDQKLFDLTPLNAGNSLIGNNETGATVRVTTTGDQIFTFLNTFSINIIEPVLEVLTSVKDENGTPITLNATIPLGATAWYNINFKNIGTDNAENTYILNTLPINVTLDESSIELPTGVTYTYNNITRELRFNIENSLVVRKLDPNNAAYDIRYKVTASENCFDYTDACTNMLVNSLESYYDGEISGTNITAQPGLNGINGCGLGNEGSMDLFVDTSSCQFDSTEQYCNNNLTISGHDGYNIYKWVDQNGTVLSANSKEITVSGPGVYTCTQTKVGCTITTRVVTVLGLDVTLDPKDALCKDSEDGKVNITVVDDAATFTYELSKGATVVETVTDSSSKTHTFSGLDIGNYSVKVTNTDGCFTIHTFSIAEPTLLEATSSVVDNIMPCNGNALIGRVEATGTGGTLPYTYSIGGAFQDSNVFNVSTEGNHVITVKDANGCTTTTTVTIDFDEEIVYDITKKDLQLCKGADGEITVNVTQNNANNTITYSLDGIDFQTSPVFTGLSEGEHTVTIRKVKSINTCDIVNTINLSEPCFRIPNFFTPDGDGINDTWYPKGIEIYPNITVKIFDRYQRLIGSYVGKQSWDGSYKGKLLPSGDYWYIIRLNNPDDNREFKGSFTLYR